MGFLYDVLYLSEEKRKNSQLNKTVCIHNFSCGTNNITFDKTQHNQKIFQILVCLKLQCDFGEVCNKIRKPINCKLLSYSEKSTQTRILHIISLLWYRKNCIAYVNIPLLMWLLIIVTPDICIKRRTTNESFSHTFHACCLAFCSL